MIINQARKEGFHGIQKTPSKSATAAIILQRVGVNSIIIHLPKLTTKMLQREMISDTQFIHNLSDECHLYGPIVLESIAHSNGLSEGRSVGIVGGTRSGG